LVEQSVDVREHSWAPN
jgi:hypothetical protein